METECKCESNFTCGHCLANAKPWHWTPSTTGEQLACRVKIKRKVDVVLIQKSVEKWKDVLYKGHSGRSARSCALCCTYNPLVNDSLTPWSEPDCQGCPIQEDTGRDFCTGTPYHDYVQADNRVRDARADFEEEAAVQAIADRQGYAADMLNYLRELKVKYETNE